MATWKGRVRSASIGGISIFVDDYKISSGRKIVKHEQPGSDVTIQEDIGQRESLLSISAYLLGDDVDLQRDKLEDLLNQGKQHRLRIPTRRVDLSVRVENYGVTEQRQETRIVKFDLELCIVKELIAAPVQVDPVTKLKTAKTSAYDASKKGYADKINTVNKSINRLNKINTILNQAIDDIALAKRVFEPVAEFKAIQNRIRGNITKIVLDITSTPDEFLDAIDFGTDTAYDFTPGLSYAESSFRKILGMPANLPYTSAEEDEKLHAGRLACMCVAAAATSLQFVPIDTIDKATELRDLYSSACDNLEDNDMSEDEFTALRDLRAAVVSYIEFVSESIKNERRIILTQTSCSLNLSHVLYGNLDNENDLVTRNKIMNPMFVPGGKELRVLQ